MVTLQLNATLLAIPAPTFPSLADGSNTGSTPCGTNVTPADTYLTPSDILKGPMWHAGDTSKDIKDINDLKYPHATGLISRVEFDVACWGESILYPTRV